MDFGKERQDFLFINKYSDESPPNQNTFSKDDTRRRNQFLQRGRRHTYPETIFQPARKSKTGNVGKSKPCSSQYRKNIIHRYTCDEQRMKCFTQAETECGSPQLAISNTVDPFSSAALHIDADTFKLLQYYRLAWHPSIWFIETQLSTERTTKHLAVAANSVQNALHDRLQLLALLAASASRLENIVQRSGQMTHHLLNRALRELRTYLERSSMEDPEMYQYLFRILAYLMTADGFGSDFAAAQVHIDTAIALIQCVGGISGIQCLATRDMVIKVIVSIHSFTFRPCKVDLQDCFLPERQLSTPEALSFVKNHTSGQEVSTAFRSFLRKQNHSPALATIIQSISSCSAVLGALTNSKTKLCKTATAEVSRWLYHNDISIRHQLLNLDCPNKRSHFLRLGLLTWVTATLTSLGPTPIAAVMSENLREQLGQQQFASWAPTPELGLWILSLGAMFAAEDSDTEVWFIRKIHQVETTLGLILVSKDGEECGTPDRHAYYLTCLEQFQSTAFYTAKVQAGLLRRLAQVLAEIQPI